MPLSHQGKIRVPGKGSCDNIHTTKVKNIPPQIQKCKNVSYKKPLQYIIVNNPLHTYKNP